MYGFCLVVLSAIAMPNSDRLEKEAAPEHVVRPSYGFCLHPSFHWRFDSTQTRTGSPKRGQSIETRTKETKEEVEILAFTATWCGPCQRYKPTLEALQREGRNVKIIDIDKNRELAKQYGIKSVPTTVILKNGKEFNRHVGQVSKERLESYFN